MTADVSGLGAVIHLGDGEHRVRFPVRTLIDLEQQFGGISELVRAFAVQTTKTNFAVLCAAKIDGEVWSAARIEEAMEDIGQLDLGSELSDAVMARMSYNKTDEVQAARARKAQEMGLDPTKPETWTPGVLKAVAADEATSSTGQPS